MPEFNETITPNEAIRAAAREAGGRKHLAESLGISRQAVEKWITRGCRVPAERVIAIEGLTGIHRSNLRPDIYPPS